MKYTAESRWFYENSSADDAIKKWFAQHGKHFSGNNKRTDHYLRNGTANKGIKLRDNRLEIKINAHNWDQETLAGNNFNKSNSWKKYSFVLAGDDEEAHALIRDFAGLRSIGVNQDWLRLDKERLSIKYATDIDAESVTKVDEKEAPPQGCTVDYTRVDVNMRKTFLSFGFEAFGNGMMVKKSLELAMKEVFGNSGISELTKEQALSFPEFILKL